jgi:hypothetical protein
MRRLPSALLALSLAACTSGNNPPPTGTPDLATAPPTADAAVPPGPGMGTVTTGTDSSGRMTVTLTMATFTVAAGAEIYKCQDFANPFGGDAEIAQVESHMATGSHHMLLFYKAIPANAAIEDCSGLEFAPSPYGSQLPDDHIDYPAGVAALIPAAQGLRMQSHYLNTTQSDITAEVQLVFHIAPKGTITQHAGVLFFNNVNFAVPPNATGYTSGMKCRLPDNVNLIQASRHMHRHAHSFIANNVASDGTSTMVYQTDATFDPKPSFFAPPLALAANTTIDFTCSWDNDTGATLIFGESAATNEMCIFTAQYYPIINGQTTLGCQ